MSKVTKALMGSAIALAGMAGVSQLTVGNIVEANNAANVTTVQQTQQNTRATQGQQSNAVSQNKVAQSGIQQLYNRLPSVDYVYSNCGMSPK